MSKIISQLELFYKKKESGDSQQNNDVTHNKDKNYAVKIELTPENMLNITPIKTKKNRNQESNSIDKLLNSLTTKNNLSNQKDSDFFKNMYASC